MSEKLPSNLDKALRMIANREYVVIPKDDIRQLLATGFIRHNLRGTWLVNSLGWEYLKHHIK